MISRYTTPGGNNNSNDTRTIFAPDGVCFFENNGGRILNKWNVLVRPGEKDLLYPFYKQDPYYLIRFSLNLNGCFICGSTTHREKNMCSMKEQTGAMDDFYRELNINNPHTYRQKRLMR